METVNGVTDGDKGGPPPPSPLTGCYLLIVVGEPHSEQHKDIILQRIAKGLLSWDVNDCLVDLEKELAIITEQALEGEEARYGERLIQFASENLVTEILIHPVVSTLAQCMRNLLSSFTRHRHIIHAGYTFAANGSWALQDGTFSLADFSEAFQELEVQRVIRAYENGISLDLHCSPEGDWSRLPKEPFTKACKVRVNPTDVLTTGCPAITEFVNYISPFLVATSLENLLESSDVVGNIRFSRPTLYVFPGGQGDAALFGINGFNMLLDGGFSRKACFWDFVRHLDRLDAVLMTRLNNSNVGGISSVLRRKKQDAVYPQIGHFFCNIQERKAILSPDGDKDKDPLLINLLDEGQEIISNLRHLNLHPQVCYRDSEPINLYHKVGHGTLDMYVLSPAKDSKEVREFLQKWNQSDQKLFANSRSSREFSFPVQNLISIAALLVWQPANPSDTITRILYPGSSPQRKIFEGLDRLKNLDFIKHPVCTEKSLAPGSIVKKSAKEALIDKVTPKEKITEKKENKIIENNISVNGEIKEKLVKKSDSTESERSTRTKKIEDKIIENEEKPKAKPKATKARSESQQRKKPTEKKASPTTPKKTVENGDIRKPIKRSPIGTPAKSAKDANNRKVIESKTKMAKPPPAEPKPKVERKPISRRPKGSMKAPISPVKKLVNGVQKPDTISRKGKLDKEGTTDSSTVSTPSADQESLIKKDISKLTPEEIQQLKAQELADLKEEQEAVKEIEAVFRKGEVQPVAGEDLRKVKDVSIDDKIEKEEYLIIEKEEIDHDSLDDKEVKEDEIQKLARDSEESEKQRKLSTEEKVEKQQQEAIQEQVNEILTEAEGIVKAKEETVETSKDTVVTSPEEKLDLSSTDKKTTDKEIEEVKDIVESHPDEKVSIIKSGDTTTAPTLPEDERIPLDEIKEDNGQIEEKHVKEETKEKEVPVIQLPPKTFEPVSKVPGVVGIRLDKQSHIRDIVKTPDEVADLPVHEEVDYEYTHELKAETRTNDIIEEKKDVKVDEKVQDLIKDSDQAIGLIKEQVKEIEQEKDKDDVMQEQLKEIIEDVKRTSIMNEELKQLTDKVLESEVVLEKDILKDRDSVVEKEPLKSPVDIQQKDTTLDDEKDDLKEIKDVKKAEEVISDVEKSKAPTEDILEKADSETKEKIVEKEDLVEEKADVMKLDKEIEEVGEKTDKVSHKELTEIEVNKEEPSKDVKKPEVEIKKQIEEKETSKEKVEEEKSDKLKHEADLTVIQKEKEEQIDELGKPEVLKQEKEEPKEKDLKEQAKDEPAKIEPVVEKEKTDKDLDKEHKVEGITADKDKTDAEKSHEKEEEIKDISKEVTEDKDKVTDKVAESQILEKADLEAKEKVAEKDVSIKVTESIETEKIADEIKVEPQEEILDKEKPHKTFEVDEKEITKEELKEDKPGEEEIDEKAVTKEEVKEDKHDEAKATKVDLEKAPPIDKKEAAVEEKKLTEIEIPEAELDGEKIEKDLLEKEVKEKEEVKEVKEEKLDVTGTEKVEEKDVEKEHKVVKEKVEEVEKYDKEEIGTAETQEKEIDVKEKQDKLIESKEAKELETPLVNGDFIEEGEEYTEKGDKKDKKDEVEESKKHTDKTKEKPEVQVDIKDERKSTLDRIPSVEEIQTKIVKDTEEVVKTAKEDKTKLAKIEDKLQQLKEKSPEPSIETVEPVKLERELGKTDELVRATKEDKAHLEKLEEKLQQLKDSVDLKFDSAPEDVKEEIEDKLGDVVEKMELGRKSPKEREEDVIKIVASVAEVLKSDAPLEEFEGKLPISTFSPYTTSYTTELRETHITTVDSPITESKTIKTDDIPPIPEESHAATASFLEEERKIAPIHEKSEDKRSSLLKESQELMMATSKMISDIKSGKPEEKEVLDEPTVHRMLVTASSEDGGEETEICPEGTIMFSKSSESSGRSSPDKSQEHSKKSSIVDTISDSLSTVKQVRELHSEKDSGIDDVKSDTDLETQEKSSPPSDTDLDKVPTKEVETISPLEKGDDLISGKSTPDKDASIKSLASGKSTPDISDFEKSKEVTSSTEDLKKSAELPKKEKQVEEKDAELKSDDSITVKDSTKAEEKGIEEEKKIEEVIEKKEIGKMEALPKDVLKPEELATDHKKDEERKDKDLFEKPESIPKDESKPGDAVATLKETEERRDSIIEKIEDAVKDRLDAVSDFTKSLFSKGEEEIEKAASKLEQKIDEIKTDEASKDVVGKTVEQTDKTIEEIKAVEESVIEQIEDKIKGAFDSIAGVIPSFMEKGEQKLEEASAALSHAAEDVEKTFISKTDEKIEQTIGLIEKQIKDISKIEEIGKEDKKSEEKSVTEKLEDSSKQPEDKHLESKETEKEISKKEDKTLDIEKEKTVTDKLEDISKIPEDIHLDIIETGKEIRKEEDKVCDISGKEKHVTDKIEDSSKQAEDIQVEIKDTQKETSKKEDKALDDSAKESVIDKAEDSSKHPEEKHIETKETDKDAIKKEDETLDISAEEKSETDKLEDSTKQPEEKHVDTKETEKEVGKPEEKSVTDKLEEDSKQLDVSKVDLQTKETKEDIGKKLEKKSDITEEESAIKKLDDTSKVGAEHLLDKISDPSGDLEAAKEQLAEISAAVVSTVEDIKATVEDRLTEKVSVSEATKEPLTPISKAAIAEAAEDIKAKVDETFAENADEKTETTSTAGTKLHDTTVDQKEEYKIHTGSLDKQLEEAVASVDTAKESVLEKLEETSKAVIDSVLDSTLEKDGEKEIEGSKDLAEDKTKEISPSEKVVDLGQEKTRRKSVVEQLEELMSDMYSDKEGDKAGDKREDTGKSTGERKRRESIVEQLEEGIRGTFSAISDFGKSLFDKGETVIEDSTAKAEHVIEDIKTTAGSVIEKVDEDVKASIASIKHFEESILDSGDKTTKSITDDTKKDAKDESVRAKELETATKEETDTKEDSKTPDSSKETVKSSESILEKSAESEKISKDDSKLSEESKLPPVQLDSKDSKPDKVPEIISKEEKDEPKNVIEEKESDVKEELPVIHDKKEITLEPTKDEIKGEEKIGEPKSEPLKDEKDTPVEKDHKEPKGKDQDEVSITKTKEVTAQQKIVKEDLEESSQQDDKVKDSKLLPGLEKSVDDLSKIGDSKSETITSDKEIKTDKDEILKDSKAEKGKEDVLDQKEKYVCDMKEEIKEAKDSVLDDKKDVPDSKSETKDDKQIAGDLREKTDKTEESVEKAEVKDGKDEIAEEKDSGIFESISEIKAELSDRVEMDKEAKALDKVLDKEEHVDVDTKDSKIIEEKVVKDETKSKPEDKKESGDSKHDIVSIPLEKSAHVITDSVITTTDVKSSLGKSEERLEEDRSPTKAVEDEKLLAKEEQILDKSDMSDRTGKPSDQVVDEKVSHKEEKTLESFSKADIDKKPHSEEKSDEEKAVKKSVEDLTFDKCGISTDLEEIDPKVIEEEQKQLEKSADDLKDTYDRVSKMSTSLSFEKCDKSEDIPHIPEEDIRKDEEALKEKAEDLEEAFETVTDMSKSVIFEKCDKDEKTPHISEEDKRKDEEALKEKAEDLEEAFKTVKDMSKSVIFEKCDKDEKTPKDKDLIETFDEVSKEELLKDEEVLEERAKDLTKAFDTVTDMSRSVVFEKCDKEKTPEDKDLTETIDKVPEEVLRKDEEALEERAKDLTEAFDAVTDMSKSVIFEKCDKPEEAVPHKEEKSFEEKAKDLTDTFDVVTDMSKSVIFEKCDSIDKRRKSIEDEFVEKTAEDLEEAFEAVSDMSKSLTFEKCDKEHKEKSDAEKEIFDEKSTAGLKAEESVIKDVVDKVVKDIDTKSVEAEIKAVIDLPTSDVKAKDSDVKEVLEKVTADIDTKSIEAELKKSPELLVDEDKKVTFPEKCEKEGMEKVVDSKGAPDTLKNDVDITTHSKSIEDKDLKLDSKETLPPLEQQIIKDDVKMLDSKLEKEDKPEKSSLDVSPGDGKKLSVSDVDISLPADCSTKTTGSERLESRDGDIKEDKQKTDSKDTEETCDKTKESPVPEKISVSIAGPSTTVEKSKDLEQAVDAAKQKELQDTLLHEKHIPGAVTPPTVPVSPNVGESYSDDIKLTARTESLIKDMGLRSSTPGSDDFEIITSTQSDISSGQVSKMPLDSEKLDSDEELSVTSQVAYSRDSSHYDLDDDSKISAKIDPMSMSFYGALPDDEPIEIGERPAEPTYLYEITKAKYGSGASLDEADVKLDQINKNKQKEEVGEAAASSTSKDTKDPIGGWGKPLGLPAPPTYLYEITKARYSTQGMRFASEETRDHESEKRTYLYEVTKAKYSARLGDEDDDLDHINQNEGHNLLTTSCYGDLPSAFEDEDPIASWGKPLGLPSPAPPNDNKGTPKKERKLPPNVTAKNKLNDDKKRAESPSKYKNKKVNPVYVDLTYVPHHGNSYYSYVDFFKRVRARYYVFSGIEPSREVYNALLEAKQTWEDKELEVTIIPTYDTDILGYWVAENEELLTKYKIDLSPSASRCTINLQDHETSCSAYRLEF